MTHTNHHRCVRHATCRPLHACILHERESAERVRAPSADLAWPALIGGVPQDVAVGGDRPAGQSPHHWADAGQVPAGADAHVR